jgi:ATP-binding cassette subfamily C protein LapB
MTDIPITDTSQQDSKIKKDVWDIPKDALLPDDPLTNCLVLLTRIQHRPFSAQTLIAGLPLESSRLTPELFPRAAARAGLSARVIKRPLAKIADITLPVVLLLKEGGAAILLRNAKNGTVRLLTPEAGAAEVDVPLEEIEALYTGFAIYVKPAFKFDSRSDISFIPRPKNWFWDTVKLAWPIYSEVLAASLLVNLFALAIPLFTMNVYDRVVPNNTFETLWVLVIGVAVIYVFDFIMRTLRGYFIDVAGKKKSTLFYLLIFLREFRPSAWRHVRSLWVPLPAACRSLSLFESSSPLQPLPLWLICHS